MGFWLDLPIGCHQNLPSNIPVSCPLLEVIFQCLHTNAPTWGLLLVSSSIGMVLAFWTLSLYGSYYIVSSTSSSIKSLMIAWVPNLWCSDSMNELHSALHSSHYHPSLVSAWYVDLWKTWPFSLIIFAIKVYHYSKSWNWLMLNIPLNVFISGTSPSSLSMLGAVLDLM